jgi:hypothetical protein
LLIGVLLAVGCASTQQRSAPEERHAALPVSGLVTLPRLASDLSLVYLGDNAGYVELSRRPDSVLFTRDSCQAWVNGQLLDLMRPLMRRGDEYVLADQDADLVRRRLGEMRVASRSFAPHAGPEIVFPAPRASVTLPAAWRPQAAPRPWRYIVIHHMASASGSASAINRIHLAKGWDGLGYHFVVGNGSLTGDGHVEVGFRWTRQLHGAHARAREGDDNRWNEYGIGICLIGDFRYQRPSRAQMEALVKLVRALRAEFHIPLNRVVPHDAIKATLCPGPRFPWDDFLAAVGD